MVIPCVSAHIFIEEIRKDSPLPVISILDVVADAISWHPRSVRRVGLFATGGTVRAGVFARRLSAAGIDVVCPAAADQEVVSASIYDVKAGATPGRRRAIAVDLLSVTERLVASAAQGIVLGCTEIPLVYPSASAGVPVFDSLKLLAEAAVAAAGLPPVVVESMKQGER